MPSAGSVHSRKLAWVLLATRICPISCSMPKESGVPCGLPKHLLQDIAHGAGWLAPGQIPSSGVEGDLRIKEQWVWFVFFLQRRFLLLWNELQDDKPRALLIHLLLHSLTLLQHFRLFPFKEK